MTLSVTADFIGYDLSQQSESVDCKTLVSRLKQHQADIQAIPISRILDIFDSFAHRLSSRQCSIHKDYPGSGVAFISQWCRRSNLEGLLVDSFGSTDKLDRFTQSVSRKDRLYRLLPRGLAIHWLAGNVPTLGFLSMIQGILTKNSNIIKVATSADGLLAALLRELAETFTDEPQSGADLVRSIAVIRFERTDDEVASFLSKEADVRVIWGSDDAVNAIRSLPSDIEVVDVIFPSRTSFVVVGEESLSNKVSLVESIKRIARDISIFEQKACASPHTIILQTNNKEDVEFFAQELRDGLQDVLKQLPKQRPSEREVSAILNLRAQYDILHQAWYPQGTEFTILSDEDIKLGPAIGNRTIYIRRFGSFEQIAPLITKKVQTVGLLASPREEGKLMNYLSAMGVQRFTTVGTMTQFELPWDGFMIPQQMVRWVSGPSSATF